MMDENTIIDVSDCKSHRRTFEIFLTFAEAAIVEGLREKDEDKILYGVTTKSILASIHCIPKDFKSLMFWLFRNYNVNAESEFKSIVDETVKREIDVGRELNDMRDDFIENMRKLKEVEGYDNE